MLLHSLPLPLGTPLLPFSLPDPDGQIHSDQDYTDRKIIVIMFICNHCPYVQAIRDKLIQIQANYNPQEVQFIGINANDSENYPDDSPAATRQAIQDFGINFPYLIDETQVVAKAYQAQCTPDIFVFGNSPLFKGEMSNKEQTEGVFKLTYHGRVEELPTAIDNLLQGQPPNPEQKPSMGCSIKWKE